MRMMAPPASTSQAMPPPSRRRGHAGYAVELRLNLHQYHHWQRILITISSLSDQGDRRACYDDS